MILGVGLDLVSIDRMGELALRHGQRFLERCFVPGEVEGVPGDGQSFVLSLARVWCLKEAFLKALGGSIGGIPYRDITVKVCRGEALELVAVGLAAVALQERGGSGILASTSLALPWVTGTVILTQPLHLGCKGLGSIKSV